MIPMSYKQKMDFHCQNECTIYYVNNNNEHE